VPLELVKTHLRGGKLKRPVQSIPIISKGPMKR
jgi:hypothetical protein